MDQQTRLKTSGSYTANLLGNIASHLAGLQGYDVMALELIQNADDAKAAEIVFDITDRGLLVRNSGQFSYCGDLERPCALSTASNEKCDYHRITDVGSGGKLSRGENIGRFGIGFVSTYQVTDHPEIRSSGVRLTLYPEQGQWFIDSFEEPSGTSFFLPWADDPDSPARLALGVSHVGRDHVDQLANDVQVVLRKSLLFLRHVRKAEVRRNGRLLLACDLDRSKGTDLIVSFQPSGEIEHWHILRADAADAAKLLYGAHPRLESLHRSTKISIGLRIDPEPVAEGLLYAFLPTEQLSGLPLHINADFFPESDRKAVIFAGHQHQQAWNEMLIEAAAAELARDPEGLGQLLGYAQLWQILGRAYELSSTPTGHPLCYKRFWERLKATATQANIAVARDGSVQCPNGVFLPDNPLSAQQAEAFLEIGGRLAAEELRSFQTAMIQLGAQRLTLVRLVDLLEAALAQTEAGSTKVDETKIEHFYRPLWTIVNDLLPENQPSKLFANPSIERLRKLPFVVTEDLFAVTINQSYVAPASLEAGRIASLLPRLAVATRHVLEFPRVARLIKPLELGSVVSHISTMCASEPADEVISVDQKDLRDLYSLFADLDYQGTVEKTVYEQLLGLPIWQSSKGLIKATHALLPGNFTDPTGHAELLDPIFFTETAREFVSFKLGVQTQSIEAFVQTILPTFFGEDGPLDVAKYTRLITELANHPELVNDEEIRRSLGLLPIVPTQDGGWAQPVNTYRRTGDLVRILGDSLNLWLDASRIPNTLSVHTFVNNLGIRTSALARHLVDRILAVAEKYLPTEDAKRAIGEAFYVLCDRYDEWKDRKSFRDALNDLRGVACFPAEGDAETWHAVESLYAPFRAAAFRSQAHILDFLGNHNRLKREMLEDLGVTINPETRLVIAHLRSYIEQGTQPSDLTYIVLNERAVEDDSLISTLAGESCIYVESQKAFVRPNQLYWSPQQLGRYAFTIPGNLESFKPLFNAIGVKSAPEGRDYIDILLDIVGEYFEQSKCVTGPDRSVYDACLIGVSDSDECEEVGAPDIQRLKEAPTILNLMGQPTHPDEVLLQDSEWHAAFFSGELDLALCKLAPELWPFVEKLGVRRLSESAKVALEFVDGPESEEPQLAEKVMERIDILARLLHDKPTKVTIKVRKALSELAAVSYELVRIQASVNIGGDWASAPPSAAHAFYDIDKRRLILERPVSDRSWPHILSAVFHQLMPEESGSEISKLTLSVRPLMSMPVDEGHRWLTDAGIPRLDTESGSEQPDNLTSLSLADMGSTTDPGYQLESKQDSAATDAPMDIERPADCPVLSPPTVDTQHLAQNATLSNSDQCETECPSTQEKENEGVASGWNGGSQNSSTGEKRTKSARPKHKEQWDRRLLSYVRKSQEGSIDVDEHNSPTEHNLAVEVVARAAVCAYEKARGRIAEQMAQTHPGYDIISRDPATGEDRFIEVKGVNGEWNQTGVGLSRLQFSNAQDYGERYWLYVVEFVSNPQHIRVHAIRSPATQVTSFMFDGKWRDAVDDERADPALAFTTGAQLKHQQFGLGRIESMEMRGSTRVMSIEFETGGRRTVTLNLQTMTVMDDDNSYS